MPHTLDGLKVDGARRELIADMAIVDPTAGGNPVPLTKEGALQIFDMALQRRPERALTEAQLTRDAPSTGERASSVPARRRAIGVWKRTPASTPRLPHHGDPLVAPPSKRRLNVSRQEGRVAEAQPRAGRAQVADRAVDARRGR